MRIAVVTCYPDPDYIRGWTIRRALQRLPDCEVVVVKNSSAGLRRYAEVLGAMLRAWRSHPDAWLVTFRAYEVLPLVLLLAGRRPVIVDELINPVLVVAEHRRQKHGWRRWVMAVAMRLGPLYAALLRRCHTVLADTDAHAAYSIARSGLRPGQVTVLPVSAQEELFAPQAAPASDGDFVVFYYGKLMTPLHGLEHVLGAAVAMADEPGVSFHIVGGRRSAATAVAAAQRQGARIRYDAWLDFADFPSRMAAAAVCLGGPFGTTEQAAHVVTGKTYQALAMARPTVIGVSPVTTALFHNREDCLLVERGSPPALEAALRWAYAHPGELARIGRAGAALYQAQFSEAVLTQRLADVVDRLRSGPAR